MQILVWGINYAPEVTGIAPCNTILCEWLASRGHKVRMLTSFAYYPEWRKCDADSGILYRDDIINDVSVHRCWHYVPSKVSSLRRIIHEATFVVFSFLRLFLLPLPDVIIVVSPPLLLGLAARVAGAAQGAPYVFHVQDLQPDAALGLGMLKPTLFTKSLYWLESAAYRGAMRVSAISRSILKRIKQKGIPEEKLFYFPNVISSSASSAPVNKGSFRQRHGISDKTFLAVYSGNLGVKQGLEALVEAAATLNKDDVLLVLCGDGARKANLKALDPDNRILFLPLQPEADYRQMLSDADVCIVTQQRGTGELFFPSKVLRLMIEGCPILAVADPEGELEVCIKESGAGWCLPPGNPDGIAAMLVNLAKRRSELSAAGARGKEYVRRFDSDTVHTEIEKLILRSLHQQSRVNALKL